MEIDMVTLQCALILAIGLGFGISCHIFASILSKSNDIGNSVGEASQYDAKVKYDRSMHGMDEYQDKEFREKYLCDEYFREERERSVSEPADDTKILE